MGVVYGAVDEVTGERCALKRIKPEFARDRQGIEAFEREYRVLAGIDHPRILRVYEYGVDDVGPYYTMELVPGDDLHKRAPLDYREACLYLRDVAASLALLHARRLLHRDLSPRNVRVTPEGRCKLLDFGALSGFGPSNIVVGTPPSIAPEAAAGAPLDQRTDLYSLGALAYWLLTRRHAYPAKRLDQLPELWRHQPEPPSALLPGIPRALDELVLALLDHNPLARPASAAAVIGQLNVIGGLAPDDDDEVARLATSFLSTPSFVARTAELDALRARIEAMTQGHGNAVNVEAGAGLGRTRLLEEVGVLAQLSGAHVLRVDASTHRQPRGTLRALCLRLLDAVPASGELLSRVSEAARAELDAVDDRRPIRRSSIRSATSAAERQSELTLEDWIAEVSAATPLLIALDNAEYADDASLGSLATLARGASERRLMIVVTHKPSEGRRLVGLSALQAHCTRMTLTPLSARETLQLARSLFGDATNLERFADFLYARTTGNPLHCLEISRQLIAQRVIRYLEGNWALPTERPDAVVPGVLESALCARLEVLSPAARGLAECLSLHRGEPTPALCRLLVGADSERVLFGLLDELARNDVLHRHADGLRFTSVVLREALLSEMDDAALEASHARLGEAMLQLTEQSGQREHSKLIEAGHHLLQGGQENRGAELIAEVASDSVATRLALVSLNSAGTALEAALKIFRRQRRSRHECLPLLGALAQAGYYEDRRWGELYGDQALDVLEDVSGLRTAKRIGRLLGRNVGLVLGVGYALLRFAFTPRRERRYSFREVMIQLFGAVTCLTAVAVLGLDAVRARAVADTLKPFAGLPERLTPVGVYQFCQSLRQIALEDQPRAFETFNMLVKRFRDPRYYWSLPDEARTIYVAGTHFARGVFASFQGSGKVALEDADALDALNLKFYAMIASELRFLYYMNRGDYERAAQHRQQVDIHAAHVGSAWQVELWEPAALIPVYSWLQDVDGMARVADRLELLAESVPSLRHYARLARWAQGLVLTDATRGFNSAAVATLEQVEPRSYIGWAAHIGFSAMGSRILGDVATSAHLCSLAQKHLRDDDREYVALNMVVDIESAHAEAGLGRPERGLALLDQLLARHTPGGHPLAIGLLHEARALIAHTLKRHDLFEESALEAQRWLRPTRNPALIAKCERLVRLRNQGRPDSGRRASAEVERWLEMLTGYTNAEARAVHALELVRHTAHADAAAYYRRVGDDFALYTQTGREAFGPEPAPELRMALSSPPRAPAPDAQDAPTTPHGHWSSPVEVELAANRVGDHRRAYLLFDEDGTISGAVAVRAQRPTKVPPNALLSAFAVVLADEPVTELGSLLPVTERGSVLPVTKRSIIGS